MLSFTWELECFAEIMGEEGCQHQKKKKKRVEKMLDLNIRACA